MENFKARKNIFVKNIAQPTTLLVCQNVAGQSEDRKMKIMNTSKITLMMLFNNTTVTR